MELIVWLNCGIHCGGNGRRRHEQNRRNDCAIAACVTGVDMRVQVYFDGLNAPIHFSCIFSLTLRI